MMDTCRTHIYSWLCLYSWDKAYGVIDPAMRIHPGVRYVLLLRSAASAFSTSSNEFQKEGNERFFSSFHFPKQSKLDIIIVMIWQARADPNVKREIKTEISRQAFDS